MSSPAWRRRLFVAVVLLAVLFVPVPTPADLSVPPASQPSTATHADSITWITTQGHW